MGEEDREGQQPGQLGQCQAGLGHRPSSLATLTWQSVPVCICVGAHTPTERCSSSPLSSGLLLEESKGPGPDLRERVSGPGSRDRDASPQVLCRHCE